MSDQWKELVRLLGLTSDQIADKGTAEIIQSVVDQHGGMDEAIRQLSGKSYDASPVQSTQSNLPSQSGGAPPPPFQSGGAPPPPFQSGGAPPPPFQSVGALPPPFQSGGAPPPPFLSGGAPPPPFQSGGAPPSPFQSEKDPLILSRNNLALQPPDQVPPP